MLSRVRAPPTCLLRAAADRYFDSELASERSCSLLELAEELCVPGAARSPSPVPRGQHDYQEQVQAGHGGLVSFSAMRSTALLARGFLLTSSAPALAGRPMTRSFGRRQVPGSYGRRSGSVGRAAPRMKFFTMRSSSEWKLITARRPWD